MRWADDYDTIRKRMEELRAQSIPKCPNNGLKTLRECLRSTIKCPENCVFHTDWTGPLDD